MEKTTITIRTDKSLKEDATILFNSLGLTLSSAVNLFLRQAVLKQKYPCSLDLSTTADCKPVYPAGFFELFGTGNGLGLDQEPDELPWIGDAQRMPL